MNKKVYVLFSALTAMSILFLFGAGDLSPTGPPGPTMKTLQQVEPRTDLADVAGDATAMHIITEPGSYYLAGNLDVTTPDGIVISASGVTLDLMGFNVFRSSTDASTGTAINLTVGGLSNIAIKNGHITGGVIYNSGAGGDQFTGAGFDNGVYGQNVSPFPRNVRISQLHVTGCNLNGIHLGNSNTNTVEYCSVATVGSDGIRAGEVHHSTAITCGGNGIYTAGSVSFSRGNSVGSSFDGIVAEGNVSSCIGETSGDDGIRATRNVSNSYGATTGTDTGADGISSVYNVSNSTGTSHGDDGIDCSSASSSYGFTSGSVAEADGIFAGRNVTNCYGRSSGAAGDDGIHSLGNVSNSYGSTSGTGFADGIRASFNVSNSYGTSEGNDGIDSGGNVSNSCGFTTGTQAGANGLFGINVSNSRGVTSGNVGLFAGGTASYCSGLRVGPIGGLALRCDIAIGCTIPETATTDIDHKYLMP